ncbi:hypothetical protein ACX80E_03475 [Arthrobacter sp. TMN-49]
MARLKKLLPYRESHIEIRDLLEVELGRIITVLGERSQVVVPYDGSETVNGPRDFDAECARLLAESRLLMKLMATGVMLDRDKLHTDLWVWVIEKLLSARPQITGSFNQHWVNLNHYPALLVVRTAAIAAVVFKREDIFLRLATEPKWKEPYSQEVPLPAFAALDGFKVLDYDVARTLPRWNGNNRALYPLSILIEDDIRDIIQPLVDDQRNYRDAFCRTEYRLGLLYGLKPVTWHEATPGLYWSRDTNWNREGGLTWEADVRANVDRQIWGWDVVEQGAQDPFNSTIIELTEKIKATRMTY